jgi:hypothetical protein
MTSRPSKSGEEDADAPSAVFSRAQAAIHGRGRRLRPVWAFAADKGNYRAV